MRAELPPPTPAAGAAGLSRRPGAAARLRAAAAAAAEERAGGARDAPRVGRAEAAARSRAYAARPRALAALLIWQAGDLKLGAYVVGGFAAAVLVFFAVAWVALQTAHARVRVAQLAALRYGLANLRRHARGNAVQVASLALGLTAVLLLTFTRNDLVDAWRRTAPPDAPNRFLIGVQPDQLAGGAGVLRRAQASPAPELYPMVRGRLVAVNGKPVSEADYAEERARRLVEREFNLSYMDTLPAHNALAAGRWLDPTRRGALGGGGHRRAPGLEARRRAHLQRRRRALHARASPRCASCAGTR